MQPDNERRPAGKRSAEDRPGRKINHQSTRWSPASLTARLAKIERHLHLLADRLGIDLDQADTATNPGVRFGTPSTDNEWLAARDRHGEQ